MICALLQTSGVRLRGRRGRAAETFETAAAARMTPALKKIASALSGLRRARRPVWYLY